MNITARFCDTRIILKMTRINRTVRGTKYLELTFAIL